MTMLERAVSAVGEATELARDERYSIVDLRVSGSTMVALQMDRDAMRRGLLTSTRISQEFMGFPVIVDHLVPAGMFRIVVDHAGVSQAFDFTLAED